MFRNWKTTLFGAGTIITGVATIFKGQIHEGVAMITTGLGLLFAKDSNK